MIKIDYDTWVNPYHVCAISTKDGPTTLLMIGGQSIDVETSPEDVIAWVDEALTEESE